MASDSDKTTTNLVLKMSDVENNILVSNTKPVGDNFFHLYRTQGQVEELISQIEVEEGLINLTDIKAKEEPKPKAEPKPKEPKKEEPKKETYQKKKAPSMKHLAAEKTELPEG